METYKQEFIEFMVDAGVLTFGDFVTKSGRKTPFFINTGNYKTGTHMAKLGEYYAETIARNFPDAGVLFGPAYKGIPLVVTSSVALSQKHGRDVAFCFNRKEEKDHGEGGSLVGYKLQKGDKVIIVEDVTTAGTSIHETMPILKGAAEVEVVGLVVSVDRMERGKGEKTAIAELQDTYGFKACPIVTIREVVAHLHNREVGGKVIIDDEMKGKIEAYLVEYGPKA
ncbi:MAG: orotate phosphoribosyltransferase [Planctomycetes bacterium]|nr:orotate phosphoribosyltransferase [Planctomycetota bacterium]